MTTTNASPAITSPDPSVEPTQRPAATGSPDPTPDESPSLNDGSLLIVYPTESSDLVGGQTVRLTVMLTDHEDAAVEEAEMRAIVRSPAGERYAELLCEHTGGGRYLSPSFSLPLRDAAGEWDIEYLARWGVGSEATSSSKFTSAQSYSERLRNMWGFWIEFTDLFAYHVPQAPEPAGRFHPYDDGNGGTVLFANTFQHGQVYQDFVMLDIHWRKADWPLDDSGAMAMVKELRGPHLEELVLKPGALTAVPVVREGLAGWHLSADWEYSPENGNPAPGGTVEWDLFDCPESEWLWTVVVATNQQRYLAELQAIRETFRCPVTGSDPPS